MAVRLIALDIDGTLLDSVSEVSEANLRAIAAAVERGIEVVLVTGRRFDFALPIARQIPCPLTMIVNNGALVKSKDGVVHLRRLLPSETARDVLLQMHEFRSVVSVVFDRPRENQVIFEDLDWNNPQRKGYFLRNRDSIARVSPLEDSLTEDPIQVMFSGPVHQMRQAEVQLRAAQNADAFSLAVTCYESRDFTLVDVLRVHCSKGATLAEWAIERGVARHEVMAIGDNHNDREMLEFAGLPVVMGNGVPELKCLGWRQTLSNDENGVAAAIETYALGTT